MSETVDSGPARDFARAMDEFELTATDRAVDRMRDGVIVLRALFDRIIDTLEPDALAVLRAQVVGAAPTPANLEILATIDRRVAALQASARETTAHPGQQKARSPGAGARLGAAFRAIWRGLSGGR